MYWLGEFWALLCYCVVRWMQLCGSLSSLWHYISLGLKWKLTFSSPAATTEFSKFTGILSAALSQHHLSGFGIAQLEFMTSTSLFIVMLPKAHLNSCSRMSGFRWALHCVEHALILCAVKKTDTSSKTQAVISCLSPSNREPSGKFRCQCRGSLGFSCCSRTSSSSG